MLKDGYHPSYNSPMHLQHKDMLTCLLYFRYGCYVLNSLVWGFLLLFFFKNGQFKFVGCQNFSFLLVLEAHSQSPFIDLSL